MKSQNKAIVAGSVVLVGVAMMSSAIVFGGGPHGMRGHGQREGTGQARMTPDERRALMLERHPEADTDDDGVLSKEEVEALHQSLGGKPGLRAMHGRGPHAMQGHGKRDPGAGTGRLLQHLDKLDGESAPEDIDLSRHADLDADGDGAVSDEEWVAFVEETRPKVLERLAKHVPGADLDGDGTVSETELDSFKLRFANAQRAQVLVHHPEADTDGDGALSDAEAEAFHAARAAEHHAKILEQHPEADTDDDGVLSDEEARTFMHGLHEAHGRNDGPRHGRQGMRGHRGDGPGRRAHSHGSDE